MSMHFRRCFVVLGTVVRLLDGNMIPIVSQPEAIPDDIDTTPLIRSAELELTMASKREATSARPTTLLRRIDVRRADYNVEHTTDIFQRSARKFFGSMARFDEMWKWDYWCMLQPETGDCGNNVTRYYYNAQLDQCLPHVFSGCRTKNNKNQFESIAECDNHCKGTALMPASFPPIIDICKLQPISGRCLGHFTMFYYDVNEKDCKSFVYGGCAGNENKFERGLQCLTRCQEQKWIEPNDTQVPEDYEVGGANPGWDEDPVVTNTRSPS
ncbi:tissue factor pathway inhibitor-like [Cydia pomonella]|uniref:tissue factor pathway inhibitor-like n=1 Tax=Cydia pomonella TaxID=82600 RepID=UPI002ADE6606|nr:tissue factor pathway inhibitor-like [Cydia pomonella]